MGGGALSQIVVMKPHFIRLGSECDTGLRNVPKSEQACVLNTRREAETGSGEKLHQHKRRSWTSPRAAAALTRAAKAAP
jgi:hypothetical protein